MNGHMENLTILAKNIYCKNTHQEVVLRLECLFKIIFFGLFYFETNIYCCHAVNLQYDDSCWLVSVNQKRKI